MRRICGFLLLAVIGGPSVAQAELLVTIDRSGFCQNCTPAPANYQLEIGPAQFDATINTEQVGEEFDAPAEVVAQFEPLLASSEFTGSTTALHGSASLVASQLAGSAFAGVTRHAPILGPALVGYDVTGISITADRLEWTYVGAWNGSTDYTVRIYGEAWPPLPGDFNRDGSVSAADYIVWRNAYDTIGVLPNGSGQAVVGDADLALWRKNFGAHVLSALASGLGSQSIPEPASVFLLWLGCALGYLVPRSRV